MRRLRAAEQKSSSFAFVLVVEEQGRCSQSRTAAPASSALQRAQGLLSSCSVSFDPPWADTERNFSCESLGLTSAASLCRSGAEREVSCLALKSCSAPGANQCCCALVPRY